MQLGLLKRDDGMEMVTGIEAAIVMGMGMGMGSMVEMVIRCLGVVVAAFAVLCRCLDIVSHVPVSHAVSSAKPNEEIHIRREVSTPHRPFLAQESPAPPENSTTPTHTYTHIGSHCVPRRLKSIHEHVLFV